MTNLDLEQLAALPVEARVAELSEVNKELEGMSAQQRAAWALENLPQQVVLTSSFGIQAAVSLHLLTQIKPDIPVILTDTGYLFPETYRFIDELTERLNLNLQVYKSKQSNAWQEARFGKLWEQGVEGLKQYNTLNKVEPMQRAFKELEVKSWFSGLRRSQSSSRSDLPVLQIQNGAFKILPIIDWSNKDVHYYLKDHNLPYHPLWEQGYVSVGDVQTSQPLQAGMSEEDTRFFGLKRECGLHEEVAGSGI
ncbi:phosphoadenosine phosphosulfate reductase [Agarivorans sp. OAG1]|uniref:Phosphoadenosine 5'-phosphosulfate reductase n=1 Tax=Agarivorans albus MKT 106 TaxID=1331007 RepID=R9PR24_AGAAL|nr:phosphoadenylyl-sulfate reductase [Agarivorans albus]BEU01794.1 phosphoadenosine phosphosulfate reductase [Agarivorans sp. OAG1]GAD03799.1 phosphoadenylyl-sulfate reductase [Agarivorans albus MKT 106]